MYAYRMIGIIFWNFNRCDSALKYDLIWLRHYENTGNLAEYSKALSEVGEDLRCLKDSTAIEYMFKALEIAQQTGNSNTLGLYSHNLALIYNDSAQIFHDTKKAEFYFQKGNHEMKKANRPYFTSDFLAKTAKFYLENGQLEKSETYLDNALAEIDTFYLKLPTTTYNEPSAKVRFQVIVQKTLADVYNSFLLIYKLRGDYKLALKYQELKDQAEDSVYADFVKNQFEFIEAKADNDRKAKEILLLSQENKLQENRIKQSLGIFLGVAIILVLIISITLLFIRQSRLKFTQDKIMLEQKLFRSQMNPHFIFNSLASVQNFIVKQDDTNASIYLSRFSVLVRSILNNSLKEQITLEEEINTIENYLALQKIRFRDDFDFTLDVDDEIDTENTHIPPMLTQPFIENAIEHGFKHKKSKGHIHISCKLQNHNLLLEIEDNGIGREKAMEIQKKLDKGHKSLATEITRQRINTLNKKLKKKITLDIFDLKDENNEAIGTRVLFRIPEGHKNLGKV